MCDGTVIPRDVPKAFADGDFAKVPVIVGSNHDEGTLFVGLSYPNEVTQAQYKEMNKVETLLMESPGRWCPPI